MTPIEVDVMKRKLARIVENLGALQPIQQMSHKEYVQDVYRRKATERLLQELIEAAIDINVHLISQTGHSVPDDYYQSFVKMAELKIISPDLAQKLAPSAGLRNRLVHEYDAIEDTLILGSLAMAQAVYSRYVKEIKDYLSRNI
jgi:uncharacterized protein YutE (UPF0331/DUF86 family)